jgi:hypothetical protein
MVSDLKRHKLNGQIGKKTNIWNMKRVRTKSALSSNKKRESICNMNSTMPIRTQIRKVGRMRIHVEVSTRVKIPWAST